MNKKEAIDFIKQTLADNLLKQQEAFNVESIMRTSVGQMMFDLGYAGFMVDNTLKLMLEEEEIVSFAQILKEKPTADTFNSKLTEILGDKLLNFYQLWDKKHAAWHEIYEEDMSLYFQKQSTEKPPTREEAKLRLKDLYDDLGLTEEELEDFVESLLKPETTTEQKEG